MKRFIIFLTLLSSQTNIALSQSQWEEWIPVHPAIQVSFKHAQKESDYSFVRFKSVSPQEFCAARVEFEIHVDGVYKIIGFESGRIKPMSVIESKGSYFHTSKKVSKARLIKLWDSECNDILNGKNQNNGVNEISFPKKEQGKNEEEDKIEQEKLKKQNEAALKVREQQLKKQQELSNQNKKREEELRTKIASENEANTKSKNELSNSIKEAGDIIINGINEYEREREERKKQIEEIVKNSTTNTDEDRLIASDNNFSISDIYLDYDKKKEEAGQKPISLNISGTIYNDFGFTTFEYQSYQIIIAYQMNSGRIFYGQTRLEEGKNYLFEIPTKSSKVVLYFRGNGLQNENSLDPGVKASSPPMLWLDFSKKEFYEEKEKLGAWRDNGFREIFTNFTKKANQVFVLRKSFKNDGSKGTITLHEELFRF